MFAPAERLEPEIPAVPPAVPAAGEAVPLDALLAYADEHAPEIQTARARVGLTASARAAAEVPLPDNPELRIGLGGRTVAGEHGVDYSVGLEQRFEIGGERTLRRAAADTAEEAAAAALDEVRWAVHVEVHRLFADVLLLDEERAQAERFVSLSESVRAVVARQVEAGERSPLVLLVADADLAETRERLITIEHRARALSARLRAVVGWPEGAVLTLRGVLPPVRRAPDAAALLERSYARHPALRARELDVRARAAALDLAEGEAWPEPALGLAYERESAPGPEPEAHVWGLEIGLPLPLWWANQPDRAAAEAELLVADRERAETAARLHGELLEAVSEVDAAFARVQLYDESVVPRLEEHLALLERAFALGEVDVHQVSQTRQRLLDATAAYLDARLAYFEAAARLEGLVGEEVW